MIRAFTLDELREMLDDLADEGVPGDTPVRIAFQPSFPFYADAVTVYTDLSDELAAQDRCIYIAGSGSPDHSSYLPGSVADSLKAQGWQ